MGCASSTVRFATNVEGPGLPVFGGQLLHTNASHRPRLGTRLSLQENTPVSEDAIAIIGIGCRTPGADNIRDFWRVLQNGECHVTDVPADRWNAKAFLDSDATAPGKAYVQKGGFINDIEGFDNGLYGINDYEASHMDPQQCLLLDCTTMALQDAGITTRDISGTSTGVFVGSMNNDYGSTFIGKTTKVESYTATGISNTILASRVSYVFNLHGPCMVLDTACSASLIAVHQGCQAIRSGDCDMSICGGANCMLTPDMFVQLSKARMISPTGLCHTFSDKADGYTRGEGCGVVILKRLKDAVRDGDNVWATVCTGTNQDGHSVTPMTAPSGEQQKKLLNAVYGKFHVDFSQLDYIEAHGTGTPAGDPVEVNALGSFFKEQGQAQKRYIGSVKTNIGHTESAAGVLGLIKVLLMFKHNMIVPSLHCDVVNPKLNLSDKNFVIPTKPIPWTNPQKIAACNCFGFGGSNSHAVVSSVTPPHASEAERRRKRCIVCFSGKTKKALKGSLEDLHTDEESSLLDVHDLAYTSTVRRDHHPYRTTFIVEDMDELTTAVGEHLDRDQWAPPVPSQLNIVYVFCGMGTAWEGMCRELLDEQPVFRDTVKEVERHLSAYVPWSLTERLQTEDPSQDPILTPIAIFTSQVGLAAVWQSIGIRPSCVVGQSIGEVAAAYTAGCLSLAEAVKIIYHRSQLLAQVTGGAMVVVQNVEVDRVRQELSGVKNKASIALEYSPVACAVSADSETMLHLRPQLKAISKDMRLIDLDVSVAYHSRHVDKVADQLKKLIQGVIPMAPKVSLVSTVTGETVQKHLHAEHWTNNMKKPVLFHQALIRSVPKKNNSSTVFLELGPTPVLNAHMRDLFPSGQCKAVPSVTKHSEMKTLYQSIATLYEYGATVDWRNLPSQGCRVTPVPRYSFDKKHLKEKTEQQLVLYGGCNVYRKNHLYVYPPEEPSTTFRLLLSPLTIPSVYQHVVMGKIVVPGALYAECGFALAKYVHAHTRVSVSVEFQQLLPLRKDGVVGTEIQPVDLGSETDARQFLIQEKGKQLATVRVKEMDLQHRDVVNLDVVRSRCTEEMQKQMIYDSLRGVGFEYGTAFSLLEHAYRGSSECLVTVKVNDMVVAEMADTTIHPCILDCMLQSTILILGGSKTPAKEMLPKSITGLSVRGTMDTVMYVHARLKSASANLNTFELTLLSLDGRVLAELTDFTVQALTSQQETKLPAMLTEQWKKVGSTPQELTIGTKHEAKGKDLHRNILLVSEVKLKDMNSHGMHIQYNCNQFQSVEKQLKTMLTAHTVDALILLVSAKDQDTQEADIMQSKLINVCLLVQSMFAALNNLSVRIPVYVCTFNAWPSQSHDTVRDVSPTETAVWGLLRTVIDEHVYSDVVAVELHMSSPKQLTYKEIQSLLDLLTDKAISQYPEVLIDEKTIYVNQVTQFSSSTAVPTRRHMAPVSMEDVSGNAMLLSNEATKLSDLQAVHQKSPSPSENSVTLKARTFARPPEKLLNTRVSTVHMSADRTGSTADYVVMALEVTGHAMDGSGRELTSCCPLKMGPEVSVSLDTTVTTDALPQYQAGDLSKLLLFWSLVDKIPTKQFSVLASRSCARLAELVKLLSCDATKRTESDVNIVFIDELTDGVKVHDTLLSLVLVDVDTISMIVEHWQRSHSLVSYSCLVGCDVQAFLACFKPDVELHLLNTQLVFQQHCLKRMVPTLKAWIQKHSGLMSRVSEYVHAPGVQGIGGEIHALLQFSNINLSGLSVKLVEDELFRKDGTYLVVGGLTGLGWICVEFLAHNNAGYIAIINRRDASPEQRSSMEKLSHLHDCKIESFQADVTALSSSEQLRGLLSNKWSQYGRLRGVFTGAAVLQDGFFPAMDRSAFEKVLSPKVHGTWNLHQVTKDLSLDYFVMHSSVASVLGNLGQANYSAANAFLDGLAFHRRHLGLAAQTINWGPLDTGLLDNQDSLKKRLSSMGFEVASEQQIRETLHVLMLLNLPQSVPITFNQELYAKRIRGTGMHMIINRFQHLLSAPLQESSIMNDLENADKIRFLDPSQRLQKYEEFVQVVSTRVLSVDIARVTSEVNLYELGLDSVTGMMLVSIIERNTSFKLSVVSVLSGEVTVSSLAQMLDDCASESQD